MRIPLNGMAGVACVVLSVLLGAALALEARAEEAAPAAAEASDSERIEELEEKVDILTDEVGRLEAIFVVPEELQLVSVNGLGPAASKVYKRDSGLSIGGYGEFLYEDVAGATDRLDALRAVLYFGYKFDDHWVFNSEIEIEQNDGLSLGNWYAFSGIKLARNKRNETWLALAFAVDKDDTVSPSSQLAHELIFRALTVDPYTVDLAGGDLLDFQIAP